VVEGLDESWYDVIQGPDAIDVLIQITSCVFTNLAQRIESQLVINSKEIKVIQSLVCMLQK
jgi:hypothetical protein